MNKFLKTLLFVLSANICVVGYCSEPPLGLLASSIAQFSENGKIFFRVLHFLSSVFVAGFLEKDIDIQGLSIVKRAPLEITAGIYFGLVGSQFLSRPSILVGMSIYGGPLFVVAAADVVRNRDSIAEKYYNFKIKNQSQDDPQEAAMGVLGVVIDGQKNRFLSKRQKKSYLKSSILPSLLVCDPEKFIHWAQGKDAHALPPSHRQSIGFHLVLVRLEQDFAHNLVASDGEAGSDIAKAIMGFVDPNDIQILSVHHRLEEARQRQENKKQAAENLIEENSRKAASWFQNTLNSHSSRAAALAKMPAVCNNPARLGQTRGGIYGLPVSMPH